MRRGAIGIGTLIVFIAMVLVAAVAAGVIIGTAGYLQQKARATGMETTKEVSSGLRLVDIYGYVNATKSSGPSNGTIIRMAIMVTPNSGSQGIDLSQVKIVLTDGRKLVVYNYTSEPDAFYEEQVTDLFNSTSIPVWNSIKGTSFGIVVIQDIGNKMDVNKQHPVLEWGDIVALCIDTTGFQYKTGKTIKSGIGPSTKIIGKVIPPVGAAAVIDFTTPSTFNYQVIQLE